MQYYQDSLVIFGAFALFLVMAIGVILVLWIAMPFSVFGTKKLLKKLIEEQERTNVLLRSIAELEGRRQEAFKEKAVSAEEKGGKEDGRDNDAR